ncbi:MAG TPA: polysaccharide export protein [Bacteroidales bacterium]|nr:polysaccharide export protein [Bacteroidales bacterium]
MKKETLTANWQKHWMALSIIMLLFFGACVPQKRLQYLLDEEHQVQFENPHQPEYRIQPGDNLYIQVLGLDRETADLFSIQPGGVSRQYLNNELSVFLSSYTVNPDGFIEFPIVGSVYVKDKTVDEIKILVQQAINEYMRDATVIVKFVNFRVSVLGEVKSPGQYPVYQTQINVFEALAKAGDMSPWGDRKRVQLVRKTITGSEVYELDLSRRSILESEFFYLLPDDIVYVMPMQAKTFAFTTFPYSIIFSTITTTLLILNFLN